MAGAGSSSSQYPSRKRRAEHVGPETSINQSSEEVIFVSATPGIKEEPLINMFNVKKEVFSEEEEEEDEDVETVLGLLQEWDLEKDLSALFQSKSLYLYFSFINLLRKVFPGYKITMEVMQNLNEEDIKVMIPNDKLAIRVMFRTHLIKWQKENGYGTFEGNAQSTQCVVHPRIDIPVCNCKSIRQRQMKSIVSPQVLYEEAKKWLETYQYPWFDRNGVVDKWKLTFRHRKTAFMTNERKETLVNEWPSLCHSLGYTLILSDFDQIYVNKRKCLFEKWDKFYADILPVFEKNIKDSYSLYMYRNLETQPNKDIRDGHACQLINSILPPSEVIVLKLTTEKGRTKKTYWKPNIRDARTSFFNVVVTDEYAREMAASITMRYQKLGLNRQPLIFGIGFKAEYVNRFLIIYNHLQYKTNSFLKALDIVFKLYHVFNLEYNKESSLMWLFIQRYFYNIITPNDLKSPQLAKLMALLK